MNYKSQWKAIRKKEKIQISPTTFTILDQSMYLFFSSSGRRTTISLDGVEDSEIVATIEKIMIGE